MAPSKALWLPSSWRDHKVSQHPTYSNQKELLDCENKLSKFPPLIYSGEIDHLNKKLYQVAKGNGFILQGGDCAESLYDFSSDSIRNSLVMMLQMSLVMSFSTSTSVVKIARIAGQFAKPRSSPTETIDGKTFDSYRGDIINRIGFDQKSREADPQLMLAAYEHSVKTINLVRAYLSGGLGSLARVHDLNLGFVDKYTNNSYKNVAMQIDKAIAFMKSCGIDTKQRELNYTEVFTSHEALLLNYEESLTRKDSISGEYVDGSAHMLWIGNRTRQLDGAHVEFLRGLKNPIGIKIDQNIDIPEIIKLINILNPENIPGRITLIARMGKDNIAKFLPDIIKQVVKNNKNVIWSSDPMHGNTKTSKNGYKTREFGDVISELEQFFRACKKEFVHPGGVHLEMTGNDVTECVGGGCEYIDENNLPDNYTSRCDPRLNATQSLELSFLLSEAMSRK
jgi:3-deoxy-7-phosphoheptulonate synthase